MKTIAYVAFLRGINVGGNKKVSMEKLKEVFLNLGCIDVSTILNSGNVLFSSDETDVSLLTKKIADVLQDDFGFAIPVLIRTIASLKDLIAHQPFAGITVTPNTRLYVTFLSEKPKATLVVPNTSQQKDCSILKIIDQAVCSMVTISPMIKTTDVMQIIEKEFGKQVTTRNWNTILKLV